jgi:L-amino acid N-acyltransferase YncA
MRVRTATDADMKVPGWESASRGCLGEIPDATDFLYALEHDGVLLAVGGIKQMNPFTAWAWVDLSTEALKHKVKVFRTIRDHLTALMRTRRLTRLMAAVEEDFPEAMRFAEHLGFERESRMPGWTGNRAAFMYVRLEGAT